MSFFNSPNLTKIKSITTTAPPGSPNTVDVYIVPSGATGVWSGQTNKFTKYNGSSWDFISPYADVLIWTTDTATLYQYNSSTWVIPSASASGASQPFSDGLSLVKNSSDNTKQLIISASNITTGTTRTFQVPDANTTLAGIDTSQTLTNKTINASNNTLSNITEAMLSFSDVTTLNASTSQHGFIKKLSGTSTQYMDGSGNWSTPAGTGPSLPFADNQDLFKNNSDNTKLLRLDLSAITTGTTRTLTIPNASDTIAVLAASQTLTNKTINASSNTLSNITEAMLSFSDITTLNVSITQHGLAPKAPNDATKYLDGTGSYSIPAGTGSTLPVVDTTAIVKGSSDATKLLRFEVDGFTTGVTRVATPPDEDFTMVGLASTQTLTNKTLSTSTSVSASISWSAGVKQSFAPNATNSGFNTGSVSGDPSTLANGDIWYNSSTNKFRGRQNGSTVDLVSAGGGSSAWSSLTDPSANLSLAMAANTTTFTWGGNYSGSAFKLTGANTSPTGALVEFSSGVSNNMSVLKLTPRGGRSFEADKLGSLLFGKDAPGNTDTDGYAYFGVVGSNLHPSGTPTSNSGFAPIVVASDGINDVRTIYLYAGSKWNDIGGVYKRYDTGSGNGNQTLDFNNSTSAHVTRVFTASGGNVTFTAWNNSPKAGTAVTVVIVQDSTGSRTISWPASVKWAAASAPTLTTTGNKRDVFHFMWDGSNYWEISRNLNL